MTATLDVPRPDPRGVGAPAGTSPPRTRSQALIAAVRSFGLWAWKPALLWLTARVLVAIVWITRDSYVRGASIWDSGWYRTIVDGGYSTARPPGMREGTANIAFFPAYPMVSRFVSDVTGLSTSMSMHLVALCCGLAATVLLWAMVRDIDEERTATAATALFAFSTGSFALSMLYSEGMFLVAAISCCWLLMRERYLLAGLAAAVGTATRPTGVVLVVVCAVAVVFATRERRVSAAIGAALSTVGIGAFFVFLYGLTGSWTSYFEIQKSGWKDTTSLFEGRSADLRAAFDSSFAGGAYRLTGIVSLCGLVTVVIGVSRLVRDKAHPVLLAYSFAMAAMLWTSVVVGFRPRMVMVIFPVFIGLARVLNTRVKFAAWMTLAIVGLVAVMSVYLTGKTLVP